MGGLRRPLLVLAGVLANLAGIRLCATTDLVTLAAGVALIVLGVDLAVDAWGGDGRGSD